MQPRATSRPFALLLLLTVVSAARLAAQGPLVPPGPPGATMRALDEVEPRIPIHAADLPLVIGAPGSYFLAGDISFLTLNTDAIQVAADHVTIDLRGFTLRGPGAASGTSGSAIRTTGGPVNLTIRDGVVSGWRGDGLNLLTADSGRVSGIHSSGNGGDGIQGGDTFIVENCTVRGNAGDGIAVLTGSLVTGCTARLNSLRGIGGTVGCSILDSLAEQNSGDGFDISTGSHISGCTSRLNGGIGIDCFFGLSTVKENTCAANGDDGIRAGQKSLVTDNLCIDNVGDAIDIPNSNSRVERNTCIGSARGLRVGGTGTYVADNIVRGNTDNYDFAAGNHLNLILSELPETIDWSASVRLAGDLNLATTGTPGISITSAAPSLHLLLDLNGFALIGPGKFAGGAAPAIEGGGGSGTLIVRNGSIRDWAGSGIESQGGLNSEFEDLIVESNGGSGILAGTGIVFNCQSYRNGNIGISVAVGKVLNCATTLNGGSGISISSGVISQCRSVQNSGNGIAAISGVIRDCYSAVNITGINTSGAALILNCDVEGSTTYGIRVTGSRCRVEGNHVIGSSLPNSALGISVTGTDHFIVRNTASRNDASGTPSGNFDIDSGNHYGQILTGGAGFVATNPWANFEL